MRVDYSAYDLRGRVGGVVRGGFIDFKTGKIDWSWFPKARDTVVDALAPMTSELIGPITSALTGVSVPNPKDLLSNDKATNAKATKQLEELGQKAFSDILNKGIGAAQVKKGKGFKALK